MSGSEESDYESMRDKIDLKELRVVDETGDSDHAGGRGSDEFDTLSEASKSSGGGGGATAGACSWVRKRRRSHSRTRRERHRSRSPLPHHRRHKRFSLSEKFDNYEERLSYLFRGARFFMIKSGNPENIALSKVKGIWSTLPINENKLNQAVRTTKNIILIFSVKESMKFSGFARLAGESRRDLSPVNWVLPPNINPKDLGGVFKVDWICRKDLPFLATTHLKNSWNLSKPIKIGRDGQEIEPGAAKKLCQLFPKDHNIDMERVLRRSMKHIVSPTQMLDKRRLQSQVAAAQPYPLQPSPYHHPREFYPHPMRYHSSPYYMVPPYDPPPPPRYYDCPPLPPDISKHYMDYLYHERAYFPRPIHNLRR